MTSISPSPPPAATSSKRPNVKERPASTTSLSTSAKQGHGKAHKHVVGGSRTHNRNSSHGRPLGKVGRIPSTPDLPQEAVRQRKKSNASMPSTSPKNNALKRNSSHVTLVKNTSQANLRKNKSATALARNLSHTQLHRKQGLGPSAPRVRKDGLKQSKGFELGEMSSDEDVEEAEWEDSATQSPEMTAHNSTASIAHARTTTNGLSNGVDAPQIHHNDKAPSPPEASLRHNKSAPDLGARASTSSPDQSPDPPVNVSYIQHNLRASRAPPAVSSIFAQASRNNIAPYQSSTNVEDESTSQQVTLLNTPLTGKTTTGSSSAEVGVSHFLPTKSPSQAQHKREPSFGSDYDSPSSFLPHYHPQKPPSPGAPLTNGRAAPSSPVSPKLKQTPNPSTVHLPSRTQQRLELQRRETMRASVPTSPATPLISDAHRGPAASRSASQGRNRGGEHAGSANTHLLVKQDYDAAERHLNVVRRFRNPIIEAVGRIKERGLVTGGDPDGSKRGATTKVKAGGRSATHAKPRSSGGNPPGDKSNGHGSMSPDESISSSQAPSNRSGAPVSSGSGSGKGQFRRQGSHDDIGLSRSQGSDDGGDMGRVTGVSGINGAVEGGMSAEEEMLRRMWESREVYDKGEDG